MTQMIINILGKVIINLITELKRMSLMERLVIIILFIIPVPFTMEGYLTLRTIIRKGVKPKC